MAKVLLTGSSDGIGLAAARLLANQGHKVTLHARNAERAKQAQEAVPNAAGVLVGDLSDIQSTKKLAEEANKLGTFDAVIHNAGVYRNESRTSEGWATVFTVNSLSPYILTSLMQKPKRLLFMSSSLHYSGDANLEDVAWTARKQILSSQAYPDSKLQDVLLANAFARLWSDVQSCSMDPGWVQTKMGGSSAPGTIDRPARTLAAYAADELAFAKGKTGVYFTSSGVQEPVSATKDAAAQDRFLKVCSKLSGIEVPAV